MEEKALFIPTAPHAERITAMYEGNGLFAKIIDMPAEDAAFHSFKIDGLTGPKKRDPEAHSIWRSKSE